MSTIARITMMDEKFLRRYNQRQRQELQRVYDEIKWYLGEELHHDPSQHPEDKKVIEAKLAEIILNGFGRHLSSLTLLTLDSIDQESGSSMHTSASSAV